MTGEMQYIDQEGRDSNGEGWLLHAAIAKAVKGELKPFDRYQGPYINVNGINLWICPDDQSNNGVFYVYREDNKQRGAPFWWQDIKAAIRSSKALLKL
jgi:hypothetical protein